MMTWVYCACLRVTAAGPSLRPRSRERKTAHRADTHFAGHAVAGHLAGKGKRQRHRVGDGDLPGDVVAGHGAVKNFAGIAVGALGAGQRAARALHRQRRPALAHRRAHSDIPVSVHGHRNLPDMSQQPEWFWDRYARGGITYLSALAQWSVYGLAFAKFRRGRRHESGCRSEVGTRHTGPRTRRSWRRSARP